MQDGTVIVINRGGMGHGDTALTRDKLAPAFLNMLDLGDKIPAAICFYAEGVKLALDDSPVLEELKSLESKGVDLIVCTTCLNFYETMDRLAVGTAAGMKEIVDAQWGAGKVITI
jgi:intracellular sulfur oxidation DsrE/DsrF family protein